MIPETRALTATSLRRGVAVLCARDAALAQVVKQYGLPPMWGRRPGFAALVRIILEQQVSQASAAALYHRLRERIGEITPLRVAAVGAEGLRRAGLTRQKAAYCAGLANDVVTGSLDIRQIARAADADARVRLLGIAGIGPWSADIYLLMALRRPDVWPDGDLALPRAARQLLELRTVPSQERLARLARQWAPWRAVAARLLWHFYISQRRAGLVRRDAT